MHRIALKTLFPRHTETLVVVVDADTVLSRVQAELSRLATPAQPSLAGQFSADRFELSIRVRRQHFFMPVVSGRIDRTSKGALVFLEYSLFPATRFLLALWSVIFSIAGILVFLQSRNAWYLGGFTGTVIFIHVVAWANFRLHLRTLRGLVKRLLDE